MNEEEIIKAGHIVVHPVRYAIVEYLKKNPKGVHINKIADDIKKERKLVSFHLLTLERNGFVDSVYEISKYPESRGRAIKRYVLTEKADKVLSSLKKKLP
jgi:predicted ArsR family transcriptional regulator